MRTEGIRRVEPVAFWSGPLTAGRTARRGRRFQVPEFQGALRLMAVAVGGERSERFGSGGAPHPGARPAGPAPHLSPLPVVRRDPAGAGRGAQRHRPGRLRSRSELAAQGPARVTGDAAQNVQVANGRERTAYFTVKTGGAAGDVHFTVTASGQRRPPAVRPPPCGCGADLPPLAAERSGSVARPRRSTRPWRRQAPTGRRLCAASCASEPLPLVSSPASCATCSRYPYGCLEQTVSAGFPLVYLADLARQLDPELFQKEDPAADVQEAIRRAGSMQLDGGGFATLAGQRRPSTPGPRLYAAHFLVEARRAGHPVEDFLYDGALGYAGGRGPGQGGLRRRRAAAHGLRPLRARAGRPGRPRHHGLPARQAPASAAGPRPGPCSSAAYAAVGNPQAVPRAARPGRRMSRGSSARPAATSTRRIRNRALLLLALLDAAPRQPADPGLGRPAGARRPRGPGLDDAGERLHPGGARPVLPPPGRGAALLRHGVRRRHARSAPSPIRPSPSATSRVPAPVRVADERRLQAERRLLQPDHPRHPDRRGVQAGEPRPGDRAYLPRPRAERGRPRRRAPRRPDRHQDPAAQHRRAGAERGARQPAALGPRGREPSARQHRSRCPG